jgi:hypothetical protein
MTAAIDFHQWHSAGTDEPRDQERDLHGPYFAGIGPDHPEGWSWTISESATSEDMAQGNAPDETAAKQAVDEWERGLVTFGNGQVVHVPDPICRAQGYCPTVRRCSC